MALVHPPYYLHVIADNQSDNDRKRRYRGDDGNDDYVPKRQRRAVPVPQAPPVVARRSRRFPNFHLPTMLFRIPYAGMRHPPTTI
jgi:hypothetical protein